MEIQEAIKHAREVADKKYKERFFCCANSVECAKEHEQQSGWKNCSSTEPTQKPINLYRWIAQKYIEKGWKVLDTHVGSASSLIAYEEYRIDYVGFEIDPHYYHLAHERLETECSQISIWHFPEIIS